jgi:hypothetical protein
MKRRKRPLVHVFRLRRRSSPAALRFPSLDPKYTYWLYWRDRFGRPTKFSSRKKLTGYLFRGRTVLAVQRSRAHARARAKVRALARRLDALATSTSMMREAVSRQSVSYAVAKRFLTRALAYLDRARARREAKVEPVPSLLARAARGLKALKAEIEELLPPPPPPPDLLKAVQAALASAKIDAEGWRKLAGLLPGFERQFADLKAKARGQRAEDQIETIREVLVQCRTFVADWIETVPWMERELARFGIPVEAWHSEVDYLKHHTSAYELGNKVEFVHRGESAAGVKPTRFLWRQPMAPNQLDDYRGLIWYLWVVVELHRKWSPYVSKGKLKTPRVLSTMMHEPGKSLGAKTVYAIEGMPYTLKTTPTFPGHITALEFADWLAGAASPGVQHRWIGQGKSRRRIRVEIATPSTEAGEAHWQSHARRWLIDKYQYLAHAKVKIVAMLAFTGDLSPTRGTGVSNN